MRLSVLVVHVETLCVVLCVDGRRKLGVEVGGAWWRTEAETGRRVVGLWSRSVAFGCDGLSVALAEHWRVEWAVRRMRMGVRSQTERGPGRRFVCL